MGTEISLTEQLRRFSGGDREIAEVVLAAVIPRLHQIAVGHLRRERHIQPVSPTELINEIWMKSLRKGGWEIRDRDHFFSIAARAMRQVLVDLARRRLAQSRDAALVPLDEAQNISESLTATPDQIVEMGQLMDRLEKNEPESAQVVDLHYFAGFTLEETAEVMGLTPRQVRHLWEKGKNWLKDRI
jgi:RNA polymerase sigma factor (TIGR02999 family)